MSTLEQVQARLLAQGVSTGTTGNWPCFLGYMPDSPDQMLAIQYTGGYPQDEHSGSNMLQTFQVAVRAAKLSHSICETKWKAMFNALQDSEGSTGMTDIYLVQANNTGPLDFLDAKNRHVMTCNFRLVRSKA